MVKQSNISILVSALISLEVIKDGVLLETIDLTTKPYYIFGRNKETCDVIFENPSVSRVHMVLQHKDTGDLFLYDLESTHGTFLNRAAIPPRKYTPLHVGDFFKVGQSAKNYILNGPEHRESKVVYLIRMLRVFNHLRL